MSHKENIEASDEATINIKLPVGPPTFKKVKVTAEDGIFKGGQLRKEGDELVLESTSARRFAEIGEVEIIEDAETPKELINE